MKRLLREPLLLFCVLGGLVFWFSSLGADDERKIVVDQETLVEFIRQRSSDFRPGIAEQRLAQASAEEVEALVQDYVREEALYLEALARGFDRSDYVLKRRLAQKTEQFATGFAVSQAPPTSGAIKQYFVKHEDKYQIERKFTFTQVYIAATENAFERAELTLAQLNSQSVDSATANQYGQRFPYHLNYVDRGPDFIASHFGDEFTQAITQLTADSMRWQGPIVSKLGFHLVLLVQNEPARKPDLSEVYDQVAIDARLAAEQQQARVAIKTIVDSYQVERSNDLIPQLNQ